MTVASATTATNVAAASQYATNNGVGTAGSGGATAGGVPSSPVAPSQQQHQFPDLMKARLAVAAAAAAANSTTVQTQVCTTHQGRRALAPRIYNYSCICSNLFCWNEYIFSRKLCTGASI
jgi:hypothetical protein